MSDYTSARWANDEHKGVLLLSEGNPSMYVDGGLMYEKAMAGDFGVIAEPIIEGPRDYDVRSYRDQLLVSSDWTQVADAPVDQEAWATYRQALRDVPEQAGFPSKIVWPEKP